MGKKATLLKNLRTFEVSLVDKGANGEVFSIIKRAPEENLSEEELKKALGEEGYAEFQQELESSLKDHLEEETTIEKKEGFIKSIIQKAASLMQSETVAKSDAKVDLVVDFKSRMARSELSSRFWDLTDALRDTVYAIIGSDNDAVTKNQMITDTLQAFSDIVVGLCSNVVFTQSLTKSLNEETITKSNSLVLNEEVIEKVGKKISAARLEKLKAAYQTINDIMSEGDEEEMKPEDIQKIQDIVGTAVNSLTEKVDSLSKRLETVEKGDTEPGEPQKQDPAASTESVNKSSDKNEDIASVLGDIINKALEPVSKKLGDIEGRVETVEKSSEVSRKLVNAGDQEIQKNATTKWPTFIGR